MGRKTVVTDGALINRMKGTSIIKEQIKKRGGEKYGNQLSRHT